MFTLKLTLLLVTLMALMAPVQAVGTATVTHFCPYTVYCARVFGCTADDPTCPSRDWQPLPKGYALTWKYDVKPKKTPLTIQCTRNTSVVKPLVTQLEFSWDPDFKRNRIWFDASAVEGRPFLNEGLTLRTNGARNPPFDGSCRGVVCQSGDANCPGICQYSQDDTNGMKDCADSANIWLNLCKV
jgi:hypothetical protein